MGYTILGILGLGPSLCTSGITGICSSPLVGECLTYTGLYDTKTAEKTPSPIRVDSANHPPILLP